jgi:DNA-binding NarL/FixJ family response regulator
MIKVLIVDDILEVRQELRTVLSLAVNSSRWTADRKHPADKEHPADISLPFEIEIVGEAANGREAICQVEALQPDVILLDLEMPILNGYEAASQIKAHRPTCRIIALTVHGYEEARQRALQAGMDDFIVKGAPVEMLVEAILEAKR